MAGSAPGNAQPAGFFQRLRPFVWSAIAGLIVTVIVFALSEYVLPWPTKYLAVGLVSGLIALRYTPRGVSSLFMFLVGAITSVFVWGLLFELALPWILAYLVLWIGAGQLTRRIIIRGWREEADNQEDEDGFTFRTDPPLNAAEGGNGDPLRV